LTTPLSNATGMTPPASPRIALATQTSCPSVPCRYLLGCDPARVAPPRWERAGPRLVANVPAPSATASRCETSLTSPSRSTTTSSMVHPLPASPPTSDGSSTPLPSWHQLPLPAPARSDDAQDLKPQTPKGGSGRSSSTGGAIPTRPARGPDIVWRRDHRLPLLRRPYHPQRAESRLSFRDRPVGGG
jgi:hypothetical protein